MFSFYIINSSKLVNQFNLLILKQELFYLQKNTLAHTKDITGAKLDNQKAKALGYRLEDIEQLEEWIIEVEDIGYVKFIKQWD